MVGGPAPPEILGMNIILIRPFGHVLRSFQISYLLHLSSDVFLALLSIFLFSCGGYNKIL